jgi:SAUR family protein
VPVYVVGGGGEEEAEAEERFVVRAELLGAPALAELLGRAAREYGYRHQGGPIRIPCPVHVFRRALASAAAAGGGGGGYEVAVSVAVAVDDGE